MELVTKEIFRIIKINKKNNSKPRRNSNSLNKNEKIKSNQKRIKKICEKYPNELTMGALDMDVNMSETTDEKSQKSMDKNTIASEIDNRHGESIKKEDFSDISRKSSHNMSEFNRERFLIPQFINDKQIRNLEKKTSYNYINIENKEFYLVNNKNNIYNTNINSNLCAIEDFNEDIYFNFD